MKNEAELACSFPDVWRNDLATVWVNRARSLRRLARCGLLGAVVVHGAFAQGAARSTGSGYNIRYTYTLAVNNDPEVCGHMGQVFNSNFRLLWRIEALMPGDENSPYSKHGKYAFQKLPGVDHDREMALDVAWSKVPSSAEFDAIKWREGRVITGAPPGVETSSSTIPRPMLLAYFDFDNDGQSDTVMKYGFTNGYASIQMRGESNEYIEVWRGRTVEVTVNASLWALHGDSEAHATGRPITSNGQYLRPFIYNGHTYLARYEMVYAGDIRGSAGPYQIAAEIMSVLDVRYSGARNEFTQAPEWTNSIVCKYEMNQVD